MTDGFKLVTLLPPDDSSAKAEADIVTAVFGVSNAAPPVTVDKPGPVIAATVVALKNETKAGDGVPDAVVQLLGI
jgi:hypothetical protein